MIPKIVYCPKCHKKIVVPEFIRGGNIMVATGVVNINCGDKKCVGKVKIKTEVKKQEV